LSAEEVEHFLLPRDGVIYSYVVQDYNHTEGLKLTDFVSFYNLPSSILKHEKYDRLNVAYSFYNVPGVHSITDLMRDALTLAKNADFDVFNALDIMENEAFLKELKFGVGDGNLHYYFYNWRVPQVDPNQIGIVLV
jgi:glycylpeptide N-tetradecanoyltransferase